MSDIALDLSGVIALLVFLISGVSLGFGGLVSLIVAFVRGSGTEQGVSRRKSFCFFLAALPLIFLNVLAFGVLLYFVDSNESETNDLLDKITAYAWLPLQPVIWIVLGLVINQLRK
jgi:hypothetical protein